MRNLTPAFVLHRLADEQTSGEFDAVCLFLDISGFTPLTSQLMQYGTEGAEVLAEVLNAIMAPLIDAVFVHGGFVAGFAGDAIKAVFPVEQPDAHCRAVSAAWQMIARLRSDATRLTRFGSFEFAGKVCIADGRLGWRVWMHTPDAVHALDQHAAASFFGPALEAAMQLDPFCARGELVMTAGVCAALHGHGSMKTDAVEGGHFRLQAWTPPPGLEMRPTAVERATDMQPVLAAAFVPDGLLTMPAAGEFRRVTSLFINCRLAPGAEGETRFFCELFDLLDRYGGYLCRVGRIGGKDSGTTLLVFFGAPAGHEDDPARALAFLLELKRVSPVSLRAGVTTGRAYAGFVGSALCEEYTCHSINVNLAARQMTAAGWDELWLDEATAVRAGHAFQLEQRGLMLFKGFAEPRPVFCLTGRSHDEDATFVAGALIGREQETAQLRVALAPIWRGRFGGLVYVVGDAGIGKSRLVHALGARTGESDLSNASGLPVTWLVGQTNAIVRQPLNPFRYMLRAYFHQSPNETTELNRERLRQTLDGLIAETDDPLLVAALMRSHSFLAALLDLTWEGSLYEQLDPRLRLENTLDALKSLFKAESLRQPLVLHIEDAHLLDAESRSFLHQLTRNVEGCPFLLILTARAEGEFAMAASGDALTLVDAALPQVTIYLQGLTRGAIAALGRERLAGELAPALLDVLAARAEGNPFFIEQILFHLLDRAQLVNNNGVWDIVDALKEAIAARDVDAVEAALPSDVEGVLTARLDRLPVPVRQVVQTAAVLGREFDQRVLAHMLDHRASLADEMAVAVQAMVWAPMAETRYLFRHALLRDAAYGMQLRGQLRRLHHAAALALRTVHAREPAPHYAELVYHYHQSEDAGAECEFAGLAGTYAATQYANADAITYFSRALALTSGDAHRQRLDLMLARERIFEVTGEHDSQRRDLDAIDALAHVEGDGRVLATALLRRAELARLNGDYERAQAVVGEAITLARSTGAVETETACLLLSGKTYYHRGLYAAARGELERALHLAQYANLLAPQAQILNNLGGVLVYAADFSEAKQRLHESLRLSRAAQDRRTEASCLQNIGALAYRMGNFVEAQRYWEEALSLSRMIGWRFGEAALLAPLGNAAFEHGDFELARRYHLDALAACRELGDREGEAVSLDTLGILAALHGDFRVAQAHFRTALEVQRSLGDLRSAAFTLTHWGTLLAELGEMGAAAEKLEEALALRVRLAEERAAIDTRAALAWVAFVQGEPSARAEAAALVNWLESNGTDGVEFPARVCVLCYRILAARGPGSPANGELALKALYIGREVLYARAAQMQDDALRGRFLAFGYCHAELLELWARVGGVSA